VSPGFVCRGGGWCLSVSVCVCVCVCVVVVDFQFKGGLCDVSDVSGVHLILIYVTSVGCT